MDDDATQAHRGRLREPDELEQRPSGSPIGPVGQIDAFANFARGARNARGRRLLAATTIVLVLLWALAIPATIQLVAWLSG